MRVSKLYIYMAVMATLVAASCNNNEQTAEDTNTADTAAQTTPPAAITFALVAMYPHSEDAFTEGLQYVNGYLYEGTGNYGTSSLRKTDLKTGKVIAQKNMDNKYFGEGITILNGKLYQLTYKERTGFIYDANTLKQEGTFSYNTAEGWGMTTDGTSLIYGDGTSTLYYLDPTTFKETKRLQVSDNFGPVSNINELEYIKGYIYANQWQTELILKIDPNTGKIVGQANMAALRVQGGISTVAEAQSPGDPEYLNGIAYDAENNRIFVTGKNWPKVFEVKLDN